MQDKAAGQQYSSNYLLTESIFEKKMMQAQACHWSAPLQWHQQRPYKFTFLRIMPNSSITGGGGDRERQI